MGRITNLFKKLFVPLLFLAAGSILSHAQPYGWTQIGSSITGSNNFGKNVSFNADGTIMAVGAPGPTISTVIGYVEVYQNQSGSWVKLGQTLSGENTGDWFGRFTSLSDDGTILAVGASKDGAGYVRLYEYNGSSWLDKGTNFKLTGTTAGDRWGECVSLSGDGSIVAIGAPYNDNNGQIDNGLVEVYEFDNVNSTWIQKGKTLYGYGIEKEDYFGYSLSLSSDGETMAVGAYQNDISAINNRGSVRVYTFNTINSEWELKGPQINGDINGERFGVSVSLNSDATVVAIGSYLYDPVGLTDAGCTRVYEYSGGNWRQKGSTIEGKVAGEQSGKFVDLNSDGTILTIGAPLSGPGSVGRARVYQLKYGDWQQVGGDFVGGIGDYLGYSIVVNNEGTVVAVGEDSGNEVRVYSLNINTWTGAAADNDWNNAANWNLGTVPTASNPVVIPAGLSSYPTLTGVANCLDLTIESASTGTGSILGQSNLSIAGTAVAKRYLTGVNQWHLVSSAVPGQTISSFLTTNPGIDSKGSGPVLRAMADYNESTNLWNGYFTDAQAGNLDAGKGFEMLTKKDTLVSFTGTLQGGTVMPAVTTSGYGWNCVGNPYPSAIFINEAANPTDNFIAVNYYDLDDAFKGIYVWNPTNTSYDPVTATDPAFTAAVGQAFMAKVKPGTTSLSFTTAMQTHAPAVAFKGGIITTPEIRLIAEAGGKTRKARIHFMDGMTDGLDVGYDMGIFKTDFNFYSQLVNDNGVDFGIQYLPETSLKSSEIVLGLETAEGGKVQLYAETENLPFGSRLVLEDRLTGTFTDLTNGEVYEAQLQKGEAAKGRFFLHTSNSVTSSDRFGNPDLNIYYSAERIYISGTVQKNAKATLYDLMGRKLLERNLERTSLNYIPANGLKNGVYMVSIQTEKGIFTQKIAVSR